MIIQKSLASSWLVCFLVASKGLNKGLSRQTVNGPSSVILDEPIHAAMYFSVSADEGQASSDVSQCRQTDISPTTGGTLNMTGVHQKDIRQDQPTHHMLGWAGNTDQFSSEFHIVCACRNLLLFQHDETESEGMCWRWRERLRFSALVVWIVLFQQPNVGERKVASFAFAFTLPLAVHVDLGHFYGVPHLLNNKKKRKVRHILQSLHVLFTL